MHSRSRAAFDYRHRPTGTQPLGSGDPQLIGPYRATGRLGAGGMGAVYAAVGPEGRCAAVKVVHPELAAAPEFLARFAREVDLLRRVQATCTAEFFAADVSAQAPWLATEYIPGPTLRQHVQRHGPLTGGMLLALAAGLAEALAGVHAAGVVHRDLKPGNVILSPTGPVVLDFGIARAMEETALTRTGGALGTPGWMAPEQYNGVEPAPAADLFAWGSLVAFAATGRSPFGTGPADALAYRTRNEEPDLDGLAEHLHEPVSRALRRDPEQRPTAAEVLSKLTGHWNATRPAPPEAEEPTEVVPVLLEAEWGGVEVPAPQRIRRMPGTPVLTAMAGLLVLVLLGGWALGRTVGEAPLSGGSDEGSGDAVAGTEAAEGTPPDWQDAEAVAAYVLDRAMAADSFEAVLRVQGAVAEADSDAGVSTFSYTENPEPRFSMTSYPEGGIHSVRLGVGEGPQERLYFDGHPGEDAYFRNSDADDQSRFFTERSSAFDDLEMIVETSTDIEYLGEEELDESAASEEALVGLHGHRYTGTYTARGWDYDQQTMTFSAGGTGEEAEFDLWVDDDYYPMRVRRPLDNEVEPVPHMVRESSYLGFGQRIVVEVPEEEDIAEGPCGTVEGGEVSGPVAVLSLAPVLDCSEAETLAERVLALHAGASDLPPADFPGAGTWQCRTTGLDDYAQTPQNRRLSTCEHEDHDGTVELRKPVE